MLSVSKRLSTTLFQETLKKGLICSTKIAIIYINKYTEINRFSVSVPKKVAKTAVSRNFIRRRVYSIIKDMESKTISGYHIVIVMKKESEKMSFKNLKDEMEKAFVKSRLLK